MNNIKENKSNKHKGEVKNVLQCIFCDSTDITKHGKAPNGKLRYRCKNCKKTWTLDTAKPVHINPSQITSEYLAGESIRELAAKYSVSTLKINNTIKKFISGFPNWEDYLDALIDKYNTRLVILVGKSFACYTPSSKSNRMFVAFAIDTASSLILAYEVAKNETSNVWLKLLDKLNCRGIKPSAFMTNGTRMILDTIKLVFPESTAKIPLHNKIRDKELHCCLSRFVVKDKLLYDGLKIYQTFSNQKLSKILSQVNGQKMLDVVFSQKEVLFERLKNRLDYEQNTKIDSIITTFEKRFTKFRLLKGSPYNTINAWIAYNMLLVNEQGFSPLSLFYQLPLKLDLGGFACGNMPNVNHDIFQPTELSNFVVEIVARSLELPIFFSNCDLQFEKCRLL